ncbi:hypothetical protein ANCDUO_08799 [Ancylostoma duodenale]|uniref:Uncharacterized protein n=1 Tax=Ancylostoma duodenale TaxID=51022 RepID=A0A0C2GUY7_9BILA|nr:hypothetical protein ANCDUO_08799 [Ancylostoma duodenale]
MSEEYKRTFVLILKDIGYLNDEYVFVMADTKSKGFVVPELGGKQRYIWEDPNTPGDGRDAEAQKAFSDILMITDVRKGNYIKT